MRLRDLNPLLGERHVLRTRLAPDECHARIRALLAPWYLPFAPFLRQQKLLFGNASVAGFSVTKVIRYGNSLKSWARGTFFVTSTGTDIVVQIGPARGAAVFHGIWFGMLLCFTLLGPIGILSTPDGRASAPGSVAAWLGAIALFWLFGGGLAYFQRWVARKEGPFLLSLLAETLQAEEIPVSTTHGIRPPGANRARRVAMAKRFGGALGVAAAIMVLLGAVVWLPTFRLLADGQAAQAQITSLEPRNRQAVQYTYEVEGRAYTGVGYASRGLPPMRDLSVGDKVPVVYSRSEPSVSVPGNVQDRVLDATANVVFPALFFSGFLLMVIWDNFA